MKKYRLKETPTIILISINIFLFFLLSADSDDITIFFLSKMIILSIMFLISIIIKKYGSKKI